MSLSIYDNAYFPAAYFPHKYWALRYWPVLVIVPEEQEVFSLEHPPSRIMKEYLEEAALMGWPVYASSMPEFDDDVTSVYDTTPIVNRRVHRGMFEQHYGLQMGSRVTDYNTGASKMRELFEALQTVQNVSVDVDGTTYRIKSVSFSSGVLFLGLEPETKRRNVFSLNVLCIIVRIVN